MEFSQTLESDIKNLEKYVNDKYYYADELFPAASIKPNEVLTHIANRYYVVSDNIRGADVLKHSQQMSIHDDYLSNFKMLFPKNSIHRKYLPDITGLKRKMRSCNGGGSGGIF